MRGKSSHTGALVIPRPLNADQYYLLSVKEWEKRGQTGIPSLAITTVDMSLCGGLGGITALTTPVTPHQCHPPLGLLEGVTAIPQCNGTYWWVITCGADSVNAQFDWQRFLYVTPVTGAGAGTTQSYPSGFSGAGGGFSAWGTITASRDGTRIAVCRPDRQCISSTSTARSASPRWCSTRATCSPTRRGV